MVHLAPDSRLLVSLVKQEQAYAAQLHTLLNSSGASLSSLSVYASSSPPTVSPVLNSVAGALSGADEALRTYGEALNDWIDRLGSIKRKEEEVANVGRDREILVTRLLKISQKSKSPPPSLLHASPVSSSSSLPTFNSKIAAAQTELQACESHLAEKERELERVRVYAIKHGLQIRCTALVQCGQVWGEMGRRALDMLNELDSRDTASNGHAPEFFKPLPDPSHDDHDSILSSLSPSQSASQIGVSLSFPASVPPENPYRIDLPPPHLVSERTVIPRSLAYVPPQNLEPETGNSSSEDERPVEVHENPRFQAAPILNPQSKNVPTASFTPSHGSGGLFQRHSKLRGTGSDVGPPASDQISKTKRERKHTGLFGSLALLFKTSMTTSTSAPSQHDSGWSTRTDRNLRYAKTDGEQSSDEADVQPRSGRLRKGRGRGRSSTVIEGGNGRGGSGLVGVGATELSMPSPPDAAKSVKKKSRGELGRSGTVRSTVSEPPPTPRMRANTLTMSSTRPAPAERSSIRRHGRTVSMNGQSSLLGADSPSPSHATPVSTRTPPNKIASGKADSLMSIVEGVSRSNQAAWSYARDPLAPRLELVQAPGSSVPRLPLLVYPPPPLPVSKSAPSSPTTTMTSAAFKRASVPASPTSGLQIFPATEKKPLRSALRNPNRDGSVSPGPAASRSPKLPAVDLEQLSSSSPPSPLSLPTPASPTHRPLSLTRPLIPSTIMESPQHSIVDTNVPQPTARRGSFDSTKTDDSASICSYQTGRENLDEDSPEPPIPTAPAPPSANKMVSPPLPRGPVVDDVLVGTTGNGAVDVHELSSSASADTATGVGSRRKSVRMSTLPPQVSATPPALDEDDVDRAPWGKEKSHVPPHAEGWSTRIQEKNLGWDDSSSEDEEYKAARKALSRADRRAEKNRR